MTKYPLVHSGPTPMAHRYKNALPVRLIAYTACGTELPVPHWEVDGTDGSVLWCTSCFPDAAPPGPFS